MALQGDGNGVVNIPNFQNFGVFSITGKAVYKNGLQMILGYNAGATTYLSCFAGGIVKAVTSGTAVTLQLTGFTDGDILDYSWARDASNLVTFTINGASTNGTIAGSVNIDSLGQYNGGQFKYSGEWQDDLIMIGDAGGNDRSYNFNQPTGATNLPDATSGQDGTLSGFTTGGFVGGGGGNAIIITSVSAYQCKQRDVNGDAVFTIAGGCTGAATVEYSTDGVTWSELDPSPTTTFTGDITINGQKDVSVRLSNDTGVANTVAKLSAAAIIVCWWQSNMAGRLTNNQIVTATGNNPEPISFKSGVFSQLSDPTGTDGSSTGSLVPLLAQKYSDLNIPVCFANVAVGGTSINMWDVAGGNYGNITEVYNDCGGLEFTLSIGGETDTINGMTQVDMESKLNVIINAINSDFGVSHYLVDFPVGDTLSGDPLIIKSAFASVVASNAYCKFGGDLSVIDIDTTTDPENDGIHIKTDADAVTASDIMWPLIFGVSSTLNITNTNTPDGTYSADIYNNTTKLLIETKGATFSSGDCSLAVGVVATTELWVLIEGSNPPVTGLAYIGATE